MKPIICLALASLSLLPACGSGTTETPPAAKPAPAAPAAPGAKPAAAPAAPAAAATTPKPPADVDAAYKELMAKPEVPDESIEVQHVLISFQGAPRMVGVTRTRDEAKVLAQKVWVEAIGGADFNALVKQYTNDSAPGIYPMTKASRATMAKSFGDVGFHLKVGEIGVAIWDAKASPFGWHIIKRLK